MTQNMTQNTAEARSLSIASDQLNRRGQLLVAYSDEYLNWQLGNGSGSHPTNPMRAKLAAETLQRELGPLVQVFDPSEVSTKRARDDLEMLHDPAYVAEVLDNGRSSEWSGAKPAMGRTAVAVFTGTMTLVDAMIGGAAVAFNPQGGKHHAKRASSAGFCVFNDMAWAAHEFAWAGLRPLYLDWDIHAGDGVQHLPASSLPTLSVHGHSIYPGDAETIDRAKASRGIRHTKHEARSTKSTVPSTTGASTAVTAMMPCAGRSTRCAR